MILATKTAKIPPKWTLYHQKDTLPPNGLLIPIRIIPPPKQAHISPIRHILKPKRPPMQADWRSYHQKDKHRLFEYFNTKPGLCSTQVFDVDSTLTHFRNSLTQLLNQAVRPKFELTQLRLKLCSEKKLSQLDSDLKCTTKHLSRLDSD